MRRDRPALLTRFWHASSDEFSPARLDIMEAPSPPIKPAIVCFVVALLSAGFAWAWFGDLAVYVEASGRIQMVGRSKPLEPQRTGTVLTVNAHNGDRVSAGDVLVQLDPTVAQSAVSELASQLTDVRAQIVRWKAALPAIHADPVDPETAIVWPDDMPQVARAREQAVLRATLAWLAATLADLQAQRRALEVKEDGLVASISAEQALLATLVEQVGMIGKLQREGWNSQLRLLEVLSAKTEAELALSSLQRDSADTRAAINVIEGQMVSAREELAKTGEQQVATLGRDADSLTQKLVEARQTLSFMTLRAPVAGRVEAATLTTIGQVVKPGQQLMLIVPDTGKLEIEAYVPNDSAGFLREGDPVNIKVLTYLYTNYGMVPGRITRLARNALPLLQSNQVQTASLDGSVSPQTAAEQTGTLVYPITVVPERDTVMVDGQAMPLTAGMAVSVDVLTERRRLLDYLISPLIELYSTSAHER